MLRFFLSVSDRCRFAQSPTSMSEYDNAVEEPKTGSSLAAGVPCVELSAISP